MGQLAGVNWAAFITGHGWMPVYTSWEIGRVQLYLCKAVRTQWFISNCTFTAHFSVSFPYISLFKSWVVRHCPWRKWCLLSWSVGSGSSTFLWSALGAGWRSGCGAAPAAGSSRISWRENTPGGAAPGGFPSPECVCHLCLGAARGSKCIQRARAAVWAPQENSRTSEQQNIKRWNRLPGEVVGAPSWKCPRPGWIGLV